MKRSHAVLMLMVLQGTSGDCPGPPVRPSIDVLLTDSAHLVAGKRVALLTNQTGIDRAGRRDVDLLTTHNVRLTVLLSPEHGFQGTEDRPGLPDAVDAATGLPIYSLYGGTPLSEIAALDSVDAILVDLQDIGARYYSYPPTAVLALREAARRGKRLIVLDRPDPLGGLALQGNVAGTWSPVRRVADFLPLPMRHGMTIGEIVRLANDSLAIGGALTVVPAAGWQRGMYYDATGLPWVKPSPNMPDLESAFHYPGTCLFEGTNLSVGRGTPYAFQVIGAAWLNPDSVLMRLRGEGRREMSALRGVEITATEFTPHAPTDGKYDGVALRGIRLRVTDRDLYNAPRLAVALLAGIRAAHPDSFAFRPQAFDRLAAGPELREALLQGRSPAEIWSRWAPGLVQFRRTRAKYLLY